MEFLVNDPGCVRHGNFINYYSFNSAEERIELLSNLWMSIDKKVIQDKSLNSPINDKNPLVVLDVGCNAGNLTQLLYKYLCETTKRCVHIFGIDIDPVLIDRAIEINMFPENIKYIHLDIMSNNLTVLTDLLNRFNRTRFNYVFSFSITMWIHLNNGDDGLKKFLTILSNLTDSCLIIEPQPWKCYRTAVKRLRKANQIFENFQSLKIRSGIEQDIEKYLETMCNMKRISDDEITTNDKTKWNRSIYFFIPNT